MNEELPGDCFGNHCEMLSLNPPQRVAAAVSWGLFEHSVYYLILPHGIPFPFSP